MRFAIVDIETTGSYASGNCITEIAVLVHDGKVVVDEFQTLVNPMRPIPSFITSLTGITNAMVAFAPQFSEIAGKVHTMLHDAVFVAHNVGFDHSFVKNELRKCGYDLHAQKACTVALSRRFLPGYPSYSLGKLCRSLGIENDSRHRAYGDARATSELFVQILRNGGDAYLQNKFFSSVSSHL